MRKIPPVEEGQVLRARPDGYSRDPFVRVQGYMVFIKNVPPKERGEVIRFRMVRILPTTGIAEYEEDES